jgi:hypothetical protein
MYSPTDMQILRRPTAAVMCSLNSIRNGRTLAQNSFGDLGSSLFLFRTSEFTSETERTKILRRWPQDSVCPQDGEEIIATTHPQLKNGTQRGLASKALSSSSPCYRLLTSPTAKERLFPSYLREAEILTGWQK